MNNMVADRGEWAGAPMPHETIKLVIEPRYPYQGLNGARLNNDAGPEPEQLAHAATLADFSQGNIFLINQWHDRRRRCDVWIYHTGNGRSKVALIPDHDTTTRVNLLLNSMDASNCWSLDAEIKAHEKLRSLVTPAAYRYYVLTGTFLETSPRSKIGYMFRKLRPTLAFGHCPNGLMKVIAALCLHPIGYYEKTFCGSMVPTDDVLAHLLLMRGDERKFWSKANQHSPDEPESGL